MDKWKLPEIFADVAKYHHTVMGSPEHNRINVAIASLADQLARVRYFGFGGDMSGVVFSETEAFKVLEEVVPDIVNMDIFRFVYELETVDEEIVEMEKILTA
jgi:hypothetical protein